MNGGLREVNLELGRPVVDKALSRLKLELRSSRKMGVSVFAAISRGNQRTDSRRTIFHF